MRVVALCQRLIRSPLDVRFHSKLLRDLQEEKQPEHLATHIGEAANAFLRRILADMEGREIDEAYRELVNLALRTAVIFQPQEFPGLAIEFARVQDPDIAEASVEWLDLVQHHYGGVSAEQLLALKALFTHWVGVHPDECLEAPSIAARLAKLVVRTGEEPASIVAAIEASPAPTLVYSQALLSDPRLDPKLVWKIGAPALKVLQREADKNTTRLVAQLVLSAFPAAQAFEEVELFEEVLRLVAEA